MGLRKCEDCGKVICEKRAKFYTPPYSEKCNYCREQALLKEPLDAGEKK